VHDIFFCVIETVNRTSMKKKLTFILLVTITAASYSQRADTLFSLQAVRSAPFPSELTTAPTGSRIAWVFNENGRRNIWVAEAPQWQAKKITAYDTDDGQEITSLTFTRDGSRLVYVRGGDHGSNWDDHVTVNTQSLITAPKVQILSVPFQGGETKVLGDGEEPVISSSGIVAFHKGGQIWTVPADGSTTASQLFTARGSNTDPVWSPDGTRLAFQSNRQDHAFIGVYSKSSDRILWVDPSFKRDASPRWSPDGKQITFIRTPGTGGAPDSVLRRKHNPWSIAVADAFSGTAKIIWKAPTTLRGSVPATHGGTNLHWGAGKIVFLAYLDGWPHLYAMSPDGGQPVLLSPGNFMAEYIKMSPDGKQFLFAGNAGSDPQDIDRRHIVSVSIDQPGIKSLTPGTGLEWTPAMTGDGKFIAYISATAQRHPVPAVITADGKKITLIGEQLTPASFPKNLATPKQVKFQSPDGLTVHAQLFEYPGGSSKKPAIIYIHGGPPRQMLLGWHYSDYYSNAYAMNQYLASRGFIVLSVNYRLGIGYGYEFHNPENAGTSGASEYIDIKAAGTWLAKQPGVDPKRIGVYGGSYGGYLTAMALAKDSDLFAAGVDIHGVHDRTTERTRSLVAPDRFERAPDADLALKVAWESSPIAYMSGWKSPVLVIHGDDDRNVRFSQSTDLVKRLEKHQVPFESLVIVDDTHHFMLHSKQMKVNKATAEFFERKLKP